MISLPDGTPDTTEEIENQIWLLFQGLELEDRAKVVTYVNKQFCADCGRNPDDRYCCRWGPH